MFQAIIGVMMFFLLVAVVWHPHPYNTEQICFDKNGDITFYDKGFSPNEFPVYELKKGVYKNRLTGEKLPLNTECRGWWSSDEPKGRSYYETKS